MLFYVAEVQNLFDHILKRREREEEEEEMESEGVRKEGRKERKKDC